MYTFDILSPTFTEFNKDPFFDFVNKEDEGNFNFLPDVDDHLATLLEETIQPPKRLRTRKVVIPQLPEGIKRKLSIAKNKDVKLADADPSRVWEISHQSYGFAGCTMEVSMKIRTEKATNFVPKILYSSLQYVITIEIGGNNELTMPFLLAKAFVLDSENGEKLKKDLQGKEALKGLTEAAVSKTKGNKMKGTLKVRLGDITYAKSGKDYMLEVELYDPADLNNMVLTVRTPVFRAYARKPNKKKNKAPKKKKKTKTTKRKREMDKSDSDDDFFVPTKRRKKTNMDVFNEKLEDLIGVAEKLGSKEKKEAFALLLETVYQEFQ